MGFASAQPILRDADGKAFVALRFAAAALRREDISATQPR
jgi:hypothetical protein